MTATAPPGRADSQTVREVLRLVAAIEATPRLTAAGIERLLGVSLGPSPQAPGDSRLSEAALPTGPFSRVALFQPAPGASQARQLLSLEVRPGVRLPQDAFDPDFLGPIVDINPNVPPEGTVAVGVVLPDRSRVFEFWARSKTLRLVSIQRRPD